MSASIHPRTARWALPLILCIYVIFGILHTYSTPIGGTGYQDAPDEAAHISYIQTLASGHMPTKSAPHANVKSTYPDYEWHQPPLYYLLAVPFLAGGTYAIRLFSLLCGMVSLIYIYKTARLIRPNDELISLCAAGIAAFTPAHVAILSAVNNDALLELCFTAVLYLLIKSMRTSPSSAESLVLGAGLGAALLTKTTGLLLLPAVIAALWLGSKIGTLRGIIFKHSAIALGSVLLLSGWWFVRNVLLYGEILPLHAFQQSFGGTAQAIDVVNGHVVPGVSGWYGYWLLVTKWCFQSFWAVYGTARSASIGKPLFLPDSVYLLMVVVCVCAIAGMIKLYLRRMTALNTQEPCGLTIQFLTLGLVTAAYVLFVSHYFQTQGRYLYPAMSAISILLAMGWLELFPARYKRHAAGGLLGLLCLICVAFLLQTSNRSEIPASGQPQAAYYRTHGAVCMRQLIEFCSIRG